MMLILCFSFCSELYINPQKPSRREVISHRWTKGNTLTFETSSNSGHPKALSLKISTVSHVDTRGDMNISDYDMGCAFVDLSPIWRQISQTSHHSSATSSSRVFLFDVAAELFDQHGVYEQHINENGVRLFYMFLLISIVYEVCVTQVNYTLLPYRRLR